MHLWSLESGVSDQSELANHFAALAPRLRANAKGLSEVVHDPTTWGALVIVRYFDEGSEDVALGWGLDSDLMELLASIGAEIDVDEY
jgi:hypothetical protein